MKQWQVVVHDDAVNSYPVVVHVLNRVAGLSLDEAVAATARVQEAGEAAISSTSRPAAEATVAQLRGYGLVATVDWSRS